MAIHSTIKDGKGTDNQAKVTSRGQLVVAPLDFSTSSSVTLNSTSAGFNLKQPEANKRFVITALILSAGASVSASGATVTLYESDGDTSLTEDKVLLKIVVPAKTVVPITGLNQLTNVGEWINIKTNSTTVNATLLGYFIEA